MVNIMKDVASALGVELGERFGINDLGEGWYLTERGLMSDVNGRHAFRNLLARLITGEAEIIKQQWKPQEGEQFYSWDGSSYEVEDWDVYEYTWQNHTVYLDAFAMGNCFRTKEEAIANKDKVFATYGAILGSLQGNK